MKNIQKLLLAVIAISLLTALFINREYYKKISYLSGDEPHYIMLTDSLVQDGEFNLKNDFEQNRAMNYYPVTGLYPHISPLIDSNSDQWYSIHTIGLPLLIYIPYKLSGVVGARIWMMALQLSSAILLYFIIKKYTKSNLRSAIGTGILLTCALFWQNMGALFPDLLMVTFWAATILLFGRRDRLSNFGIMAFTLLSGLIHTKSLLLIGPIVFAHVLLLIQKDGVKDWVKKYGLINSITISLVLIYIAFLYKHYGVFSPSQLYGTNGQLFAANPISNTIAIITDRSKGLLVYAPFIAVAGPYLFYACRDLFVMTRKLLSRKKKHTFSTEQFLISGVLLGLSLLLITQIGFLDWSGSTAPNGRYMLPFIFGIIFLISRYLNLQNRLEILVISASTMLGIVLSRISIFEFPNYMSTGVNSFLVTNNPILLHLPLFNITSDDAGRAPSIWGAKWLIVLLILNIFLINLYRYKIIFKKRTSYI